MWKHGNAPDPRTSGLFPSAGGTDPLGARDASQGVHERHCLPRFVGLTPTVLLPTLSVSFAIRKCSQDIQALLSRHRNSRRMALVGARLFRELGKFVISELDDSGSRGHWDSP